MKKILLVIAIMAILGLIVTACTPQPQTAQETTVQETVVTEVVEREVTRIVEVDGIESEVTRIVQEEVLVTPTPQGRAEPRRGGTIVVSFYKSPPHLDPWDSSGSQWVLKRLYSYLVNVNPELEIEPNLAERWEISEDGTTYTFHLRENALWHDGEPVTADDVKFTFERAAFPEAASPFRADLTQVEGAQDFIDGNTDEITGIQAVDEHTIQIVLTEPNVSFLSGTFWQAIAPKHIWEDIPVGETSETEFAREMAIGSGPFRVTEFVIGEVITFDRNPDYFIEGLPYVDRLIFRIFQNQPAAIAALEAGEVDVAELGPNDVSRIESIPYLGVHEYIKRGLQYLTFNLDVEPWNNPEVRKAIAHAIDREGICASIFAGGCEPVDHVFHIPWTWSSNAPRYPYDPEKARVMLEEAGVDLGEIPLLTYYTTAEPEAIQALLGEVGVDVRVMALDVPAYVEERTKDTWQLSYIGTFGGLDPNIAAGTLACPPEPERNYTRYCNPEVDRLFELGRRETDFEERQKIYQQIDEIVMEELGFFPLFITNLAQGYNKRVVNMDYNPWWYDHVEEWYVFE